MLLITHKSLALNQSKSLKGFTMTELIMVIVILGILSLSVLPRLTDKNVFESRGFRDESMALLRYAQKSAVAQRRIVCVSVASTGLSFTIADNYTDSSCGTTPLTLASSPRGGSGMTGSAFNFLPSGATNQTGTIVIGVADASEIKIDAVTGYVR